MKDALNGSCAAIKIATQLARWTPLVQTILNLKSTYRINPTKTKAMFNTISHRPIHSDLAKKRLIRAGIYHCMYATVEAARAVQVNPPKTTTTLTSPAPSSPAPPSTPSSPVQPSSSPADTHVSTPIDTNPSQPSTKGAETNPGAAGAPPTSTVTSSNPITPPRSSVSTQSPTDSQSAPALIPLPIGQPSSGNPASAPSSSNVGTIQPTDVPSVDSAPQHHTTNTGAIAGGVVGGIAALVVLGTGIYYFWSRRSAQAVRLSSQVDMSRERSLTSSADFTPASMQASFAQPFRRYVSSSDYCLRVI